MKIRIRFSLSDRLNGIRRRFPVPAVLCVMTAGIFILACWLPYDQNQEWQRKLLPSLFSALCWSAAGCLLAEGLGKERFRTLFALLPAAGAGLTAWLVYPAAAWLGLSLAAAVLCLWLYSRGEEPRPRRLLRAVFAVLTAFTLALLLCGILTILHLAVNELFLRDAEWRVRDNLLATGVIVSFHLAAPLILFSLLPELNEPLPEKDSWLRTVLAWVILPAYLLLLSLLLIYLAVILLRWELPVGQLNPFALLALGVYVFLQLTLTGDENFLSRWFIRFGAWPLIPVLIAQGIAVGIRVSAYGLTPSRIGGIAFSAVCLIAVVAGLLRRRGWAVLPAAALVLVLLSVPPLSADRLARIDQENRLAAALNRAGMLDASGEVCPNPDAADADKRIIWSSMSALHKFGNLPENSLGAVILRQADQREPGGYYAFGLREILGFEDPASYRAGSARICTVKGTATGSELDVRGFSHASYVSTPLSEEEGYSLPQESAPFTLSDLLKMADFDQELLIQGDFVFDSGVTIRLVSASRTDFPDDPTHPARYHVNFWALTP